MAPPQKKINSLSIADVQNLTNINEIEKLLKETQIQEQELEIQMEESIKNDKNILETKLELLEILPTKLKPIYSQINTLSNKIEETCFLAENVSKKVRLLDNTRHRLQQTQQRLEDIIHVRDCIEGIDGAMKNEEWERACEYIKTYLSIVTQENLENENFAKSQEKGGNINQINLIESSPKKKVGKVLEESSENLLQQKLIELRSIIQEKADKAENEEEVKRFCKLFSPLGIPQVGLQRYISFIRNSLKQDAEKIHISLRKSIEKRNITEEEYLTCIEAITKLYEDVAEYAETRGDVVKETFGQQGGILLLRNLQQECDVHSTRILQKFQEFFKIPLMVMEVANYSKRAPKFGGGEIQKKDPSEFGELLDAIALVSQRTELFDRFLRKKAKSFDDSSDHHHHGNVVHSNDQNANQQQQPQLHPPPGLLHVSETNRKIQEILDQYIILEQYFMVENVQKAIKIDQENTYQQKNNNNNNNNNKYQSQLVDYVFFILQKSLFRSLSTYNQQSICAIINFVNQCYSIHLKEELINLMQSIPGSSGFPRNPDPTANYMNALNSIYQSSENMIKMKVETENEVNHIFALYSSSKQLISACTTEFQETSKEYKAILKQNLELLVNSVQPKLKSAIDLFRAANFEINELQFSENEINDPFAFRFLEDVQAIFQSFSNQLIKENYETLIQICLHSITLQLEKTLLQKKFTQLGGIQFDKDLRLIVNYFSNHTQRAVRGEFARLMQMASLLNLEKVSEVLDYWGENSGQMTWRLTPSEVRRTLSRRVDFSGEDIANLKL